MIAEEITLLREMIKQKNQKNESSKTPAPCRLKMIHPKVYDCFALKYGFEDKWLTIRFRIGGLVNVALAMQRIIARLDAIFMASWLCCESDRPLRVDMVIGDPELLPKE